VLGADQFKDFEFFAEMLDAGLDVQDHLAGLLKFRLRRFHSTLLSADVRLILLQQMLTTETSK